MLRVLRTLLMWLLAMAIPVQGLAAASMAGCGADGHGVKPHAHAAAHGHPAGVLTHGQDRHSHDSDANAESPHHADSSAVTGSGPSAEAKAAKPSVDTCSVCASCCTAAALPSALVALEPAPLDTFSLPLALRSVALFLTGGPERPPRFFLA